MASHSMHIYFRDHVQLEWILTGYSKLNCPFDVVPVDDTQQRRTICTAQACPLNDHMLHELCAHAHTHTHTHTQQN